MFQRFVPFERDRDDVGDDDDDDGDGDDDVTESTATLPPFFVFPHSIAGPKYPKVIHTQKTKR